ncbi:MAG: hypothetical protein HFI71_14730 [Lachnospiraceae bacterium]|nr:hypothetical protein [Lachnospiraceae bacterium]
MREFAVKLEKKNEDLSGFSIKEEQEFLKRFKNPKDDIERSYFQYCCQMRKNKPIITFLLNIISLPIIIFYLIKPKDRIDNYSKCQGVFFSDGKPFNIIPTSLKNNLVSIYVVEEKQESITREDLIFLCRIFLRYPLSWHFLLKILIKVRFYCYEIIKRSPSSIIVCNEYSFTSSVMTYYCMLKGIQHFNIMHGEKIFDIQDSFFRFDRCYVWDNYYKELFINLKAEPHQFIVEIPESLKFPNTSTEEKKIDYTYYLGWEEGEKLSKIVEIMHDIKQRGYRVAIRPHPRYTKMDELMKLARYIQVEDFKTLKIEESLFRTRNAISIFSTVLNQAYYNGVSVVIDDISDPQKYKKIVETNYIMLCKPHICLSELFK